MASGLSQTTTTPERVSARVVLAAALAVFLVYAWPGYVGWDTLAHLIAARTGDYTDAHPPAIARLWRVVELFVAGPAGMLLIQASSLMFGLHAILSARALRPRTAAVATALVFLFPPIAGVTALVVKDALMAGFLMCAVAWMNDPRRSRRTLCLVALVAASAMRWNALAATLPLVVLMFRWDVAARGVRRYGVAVVAWLGVTAAAMALNALLTTRPVHAWYGSQAYQDIAGTLVYADLDDAAIDRVLDGVPLRAHDELNARFHATYDAADYRQLTAGDDPLFEVPRDDGERAAVARAWRELVFGHPAAYLRYRWDNFRNLLRIDEPRSFAHVYVWFHVIAAPETVDQLEHDAAPGRIQDVLRRASVWLSTTPLYWPWIYLVASTVLLVAWRRDRLVLALLASGIVYELAWFFVDPTGDFRYSQWLVVCCAVAIALRIAGRRATIPAA